MKPMSKILIVTLISMLFSNILTAQNVGITDDGNSFTPNSSSVLELKSTSKGLLIPRMTNAQRVAITSPATGLMVYQTDGNEGFWFFNGSQWVKIGEENSNPVSKSVSCTLTTKENLVLASGDITLTLPVITSANNGLAITIKHVGDAEDLVMIEPNSGSSIDGKGSAKLFRWQSKTFLAVNGEWIIKEKDISPENVYDVSPSGSWTTIQEVISFLENHMTDASTIRLNSGSYGISSTIEIDLPYSLTIQGVSYGTILKAESGLEESPMFICNSECIFKILEFDGTTLSGYGSNAGEDAIRFVGSGSYYEVKDCIFRGFHRGLVVSNDVELWVFETDFEDMNFSAIQIASYSNDPVNFKISECDFINCRRSIELKRASGITSSIMNCGFYNENSTDTSVTYYAGFIKVDDMFFTGNTWNYVGKFFVNYDFTRTDARDADIKIFNNIGIEDQNPKCKINVNNNTQTTSASTSWVKANWTNTSYLTCKFSVINNKITYQPKNRMYGLMIITGNIAVSSSSRTISIGIVKNGNSATRYGECDLKPSAANIPMQFATVVFVENIDQNDYFELYVKADATCTVTFQDVQWFTTTF